MLYIWWGCDRNLWGYYKDFIRRVRGIFVRFRNVYYLSRRLEILYCKNCELGWWKNRYFVWFEE